MQIDPVGVVIGIVGIVVGYFLYRKGLRLKEPNWGIQSNNLIQNQTSVIPDLTILFKDENVSNLTVSKIVFWNNGMETIVKADLGTINPLKVSAIGNTKLLETKIIMTSNKSNRFVIHESEEKTFSLIGFDYLDHLQGAIIQVVHTGISSQDVNVEGDIIGVKHLKQVKLPALWDTSKNPKNRLLKIHPKISNYLSIIGLSLGVTVLGVIISIVTMNFVLFYSNYSYVTTALVIGLVLYLPSLYIAYKINDLLFPRSTPESFEDYLVSLYSSEKH